jgi:hypothetical protein
MPRVLAWLFLPAGRWSWPFLLLWSIAWSIGQVLSIHVFRLAGATVFVLSVPVLVVVMLVVIFLFGDCVMSRLVVWTLGATELLLGLLVSRSYFSWGAALVLWVGASIVMPFGTQWILQAIGHQREDAVYAGAAMVWGGGMWLGIAAAVGGLEHVVQFLHDHLYDLFGATALVGGTIYLIYNSRIKWRRRLPVSVLVFGFVALTAAFTAMPLDRMNTDGWVLLVAMTVVGGLGGCIFAFLGGTPPGGAMRGRLQSRRSSLHRGRARRRSI